MSEGSAGKKTTRSSQTEVGRESQKVGSQQIRNTHLNHPSATVVTKDPAKRLGGGPSDGEEVARCVL